MHKIYKKVNCIFSLRQAIYIIAIMVVIGSASGQNSRPLTVVWCDKYIKVSSNVEIDTGIKASPILGEVRVNNLLFRQDTLNKGRVCGYIRELDADGLLCALGIDSPYSSYCIWMPCMNVECDELLFGIDCDACLPWHFCIWVPKGRYIIKYIPLYDFYGYFNVQNEKMSDSACIRLKQAVFSKYYGVYYSNPLYTIANGEESDSYILKYSGYRLVSVIKVRTGQEIVLKSFGEREWYWSIDSNHVLFPPINVNKIFQSY